MHIYKILVATLLLITSVYSNAQAAIHISNGATEDFLWAPISARYSIHSLPTDYVSISAYHSNTTPSITIKASGRNGYGVSDNFHCSISHGDPIYNEVQDMVYSMDDGSLLEVFKNKSTGKCFRVVLQKRSDVLHQSQTGAGSSLVETPPFIASGTQMSGAFGAGNGSFIAKTDWQNTVTFYASGGGSSTSCPMTPTVNYYDIAVRLKNALRNGYYIALTKPASDAAAQCWRFNIEFSTKYLY